MFDKGEYVVCGNKGVCRVEEITTLDISGVDKKREYYILKPVYVPGSTVYVPVDASTESIRKVLEHEEAERLIQDIAKVPLITITNDKLLEQEYRSCMKTNCCEEWIKILKTISLRRQRRIEAGRKITAIDAKYSRLAEDNLYGELAISLNLSKGEVENCILQELGSLTGVVQV